MKTGPEDETRRYSRRGFLRRAGAGAGAVALSGSVGAGIAPRAAAARSATVETSRRRFGRLFSNLRPFAAAADDVKAALVDLGKRGGLVDAADDLANLQGFYGSDGTRTRDLRRDRPVLVVPD
jgi:hypothetical protein